jgi:hypothetical protein
MPPRSVEHGKPRQGGNRGRILQRDTHRGRDAGQGDLSLTTLLGVVRALGVTLTAHIETAG